jgi:hypothetical protein
MATEPSVNSRWMPCSAGRGLTGVHGLLVLVEVYFVGTHIAISPAPDARNTSTSCGSVMFCFGHIGFGDKKKTVHGLSASVCWLEDVGCSAPAPLLAC